MARISSAVASHPGLRRVGNEDAFCVRADLGLYIVADGMGGHAAGEVASRLAVDAVEAFVEDTRSADENRTWPFPYNPAISLEANRLTSSLRLANRRIAGAMERDNALRGMATTAAAVLVGQARACVAHVGDSRVYLSRAGAIRQVTHDHSWVSEQVRAGSMTEADAREHPWRNVVTRAIAGGDDPEIDVVDLDVQPDDRFLICSDGLSGVVANDVLQRTLETAATLQQACDRLVAAANEAGGPDNITVIVLKFDVD